MKRILIADDHMILRQGLKQILIDEFADAKFGEAADAPQVLTLLRRQPWDVLILDINMPGRNGFEVLDESSVGKHIALGFFAERLELYAGPLARALGRALSAAKLSDRAVYVNPRDIMCITARKRR